MDKKFIVVVDGDNFHPKFIDYMIDDIKSRGSINSITVYANYTDKEHTKYWERVYEKYQTRNIQVWSNGRPQAVDMQLIMETCIDITVNKDSFTHLAIASGDRDLSHAYSVAKRLGKRVIGYSTGEGHTSKYLKRWCHEFIICKSENIKEES